MPRLAPPMSEGPGRGPQAQRGSRAWTPGPGLHLPPLPCPQDPEQPWTVHRPAWLPGLPPAQSVDGRRWEAGGTGRLNSRLFSFPLQAVGCWWQLLLAHLLLLASQGPKLG